MDVRFTVHAGPHRQVAAALIALGLVLIGSAAVAAPKRADARAAFDRGVKAYQAADYAAASAALGESFELEPDAETLFAWAQAERKLEHCDKAVELWTRLSQFELPAENKAVVKEKVDECEAILVAQRPVVVEPKPEPVIVQPVEPDPEPPVVPERTDRPRARWKNPVGLTLVGLGVVGLGVGTTFLLQARTADKAKTGAVTYDEFLHQRDKATSRGRFGVIGLAAGGALITAGVVWIVTRPQGHERPALSAWTDGSGGGLVYTSGF